METIRIRDAVENDLPVLLSIYNDIILHTTAVYDYEPHTLEMRRQWFATKQQQGFPVFVAEEEGKILGFSSIGPFRAKSLCDMRMLCEVSGLRIKYASCL